jgi:D-alanine transaminase
MFRFREHFDRLARSLKEIQLPSPHTHGEWLALLDELIRRNGSADMYVYVQVTRGVEYGRNHAFPQNTTPSVFAMAAPLPRLKGEERETGVSAITVQDCRWGRCDIKATGLLANVLMKQQAAEAGAQEAIIVSGSEVLEGASTSVFVVRGDSLLTPPNSHRILPGTTRDVVLELAAASMSVEIRPISLQELREADEVWLSAATRDAIPVTKVDGARVGTGRPGVHWKRIDAEFAELRTRLAASPVL